MIKTIKIKLLDVLNLNVFGNDRKSVMHIVKDYV